MRRVRRDDAAARSMVEAAIGKPIYEPFAGLVVEDGGDLVSAFILNNYDGRDVHLTGVNLGVATVHMVRHIAHCVFVNMGCHRVTAVTRADNGRAIYALTRLGFINEGRLREHFDGADGLVFGLLRSEQKLLRL